MLLGLIFLMCEVQILGSVFRVGVARVLRFRVSFGVGLGSGLELVRVSVSSTNIAFGQKKVPPFRTPDPKNKCAHFTLTNTLFTDTVSTLPISYSFLSLRGFGGGRSLIYKVKSSLLLDFRCNWRS